MTAVAAVCALFPEACRQSTPAGSSAPQSGVQFTTETPGHYPVAVTNYDESGEEVSYTYPQVPERMEAVYQGSIETMIALGLGDHAVASYGLDNEIKPECQEDFSSMHYLIITSLLIGLAVYNAGIIGYRHV